MKVFRMLFSATLLLCTTLIISAQNKIVVQKTDGTEIKYNISEINKLYFLNEESVSITAKAVDLGLPSGTMWADRNIGALSPEYYGDYFAWGETSPKSEYSENNCVTYNMSNSEMLRCKIIDSNGNLTKSYDAATVNWGDGWRMPTNTEIQELINNCTWTWTRLNGVNGYKVTGKNGNFIFLPAASFKDGCSIDNVDSYGRYWGATVNADEDGNSYILRFYDDGEYYLSYRHHYYGQSIRPVQSQISK